jgi:hypothetical protein
MSDNTEATVTYLTPEQRKLANLRPWQPGQSGNPLGRPEGAISLETRIKRILEGDVPLPKAIEETIRNVVGDNKKPIDAMIIAGLLQALQGDKQWADWLSHNGFGKPKERIENTGPDGGPQEFLVRFKRKEEE